MFTPLAPGPATAEKVASACQSDAVGIKALLDNLCAARVLGLRGAQYALTPTAQAFRVRGRKAYVGDMILDYTNPAMFDSILNSIRTGTPRSLNENFVQDAWLESYSAWRIPKSLEMWQTAGITTQRSLRILDLACGCAIKSFALAQTSPNAHVTCLDSSEVLEVARDLAGRMALSAQVVFSSADLFTADLDADEFDAVLVGQITHYLTARQNQNLFQRIYSALTKAGTLVIDCPMSGEALTEQASFLTLFLWANGGGTAHSFGAYREWLTEAGFGSVNQLSDRWLAAKK